MHFNSIALNLLFCGLLFSTDGVSSRPAVDEREIILFPEPEFKGQPTTVILAIGYCTTTPARISNNVSSIIIGDICIEIFKTKNCTGESKVLDGNAWVMAIKVISNLYGISMNDQVESISLC